MTNVNNVAFFWVNPGTTESVTYQYCVGANNTDCSSVSAPFTINGPTGVTVVTYPTPGTLAPVNVLIQTDSQTYLELGTGNGNTPATLGIILQATTSNSGWYEWVQLINTDHIQYLDSGGKHGCIPKNWTGQSQLDDVYPFSSGIANQQVGNVTQDSPRTPLAPEISQSFGADMYLLWDPAIPPSGQSSCTPATVASKVPGVGSPSTCSSNPVPLGHIHWQWSGDAVDTLAVTTGDNLTTGHLLTVPKPQNTLVNAFVPDSTYPYWTNFIASGVPLSQTHTCQAQ
jgi:hypothetical protein